MFSFRAALVLPKEHKDLPLYPLAGLLNNELSMSIGEFVAFAKTSPQTRTMVKNPKTEKDDMKNCLYNTASELINQGKEFEEVFKVKLATYEPELPSLDE